MRMKPLRITYIGGCHLIGYPVGNDLGFPRLLASRLASLGVVVEPAILQPVPVRVLAQMIAFVEASQPEVVILQLGNFETSLTVGSLLRRAVGLRGARSEGAFVPDRNGGFLPRPDAFFQPGNRVSFRRAGKSVLHRVWLSRLVRPQAIAARMDEVALAIAATCHAPVFLLDPLPCADPLVAAYREQVAQAMPAHRQEYRRVQFGRDSGAVLPPEAFADPVHLAASGQRFVANRVFDVMAGVLDLPPGDGRLG